MPTLPPPSRTLAAPVVLFDLDGTLTDSAPGITRSFRHALAAVDYPVEDDDDLRWCIGPPFRDLFPQLGITGARADAAFAAYRAVYDVAGAFENSVYPGIPELLDRLIAGGRTLGVATSKPEVVALPILEHFSLAGRFAAIAGAELEQPPIVAGSPTWASKAEVLARAFELLGHPDPSDVVLVGDRIHDIEGARHHGIGVIGVDWGFAVPGELAAAAPDAIVDTVADLAAMLGLPA